MEIKEIINKTIWENFIGEYSPISFFQSWNWGEVQRNIKNKLWRLGIYDGNKLMGIAQVNKVLAKKGNFLHVRHGPILSVWSKKCFNFLLDYLKTLNKTEKTVFLRISPLLENNNENKSLFKHYGFIDAPIHAMDGEYCWVVDLKQTEDEILRRMRKTTRYLIKQAQKMDINIIKSKDKDDLIGFLSLYEQTAKRHNFIAHKGIMEEFEQLLADDEILLFMGFHQKKLLSAALIIFYNNQAIYHHSASIEQKVPVNYLLQWEVIKEAKARKIDLYNMWGITPPNKPRHPWKGLTIFKQGFGGEVKEYLHAKDLPFSISYCATYLWDWVRKIRKGY